VEPTTRAAEASAAREGGEELLEAQRQIRQLKETVAALRGRLEENEAGHAGLVQAGHDEAHQLHLTIQTLRDQLERELYEHRDGLARQQKSHQDELKQLHDAIAALRQQLENHHGS
jgi:chromosome segregation ATPase